MEGETVTSATLPESYQAARRAIAQCAKIDECQSWADKAEAIRSYAKQADDETMMNHATRIKARAIQRCGELLEAFEAKSSGRGATTHHSARAKAARAAGLSKDQRHQAQRVANYAKKDPNGFERAVEGKKPATVTELARRGTQKNLIDLGGRDPVDFENATNLMGAIGALRRFINDRPPIIAAIRGLSSKEKTAMRNNLDRCIQFFTDIRERLDD